MRPCVNRITHVQIYTLGVNWGQSSRTERDVVIEVGGSLLCCAREYRRGGCDPQLDGPHETARVHHLLGCTAVAWPLAARSQQDSSVRVVGWLDQYDETAATR